MAGRGRGGKKGERGAEKDGDKEERGRLIGRVR